MKVFKLLMIIAISISVFTQSGCMNTPAENWRVARNEDSIESYERFIKAYPDEIQAKKARIRITELREDQDWWKAKKENSIQSFRSFRSQYPDSKRNDEAIASEKIIADFIDQVRHWNLKAVSLLESYGEDPISIEQLLSDGWSKTELAGGMIGIVKIDKGTVYIGRFLDIPETIGPPLKGVAKYSMYQSMIELILRSKNFDVSSFEASVGDFDATTMKVLRIVKAETK